MTNVSEKMKNKTKNKNGKLIRNQNKKTKKSHHRRHMYLLKMIITAETECLHRYGVLQCGIFYTR